MEVDSLAPLIIPTSVVVDDDFGLRSCDTREYTLADAVWGELQTPTGEDLKDFDQFKDDSAELCVATATLFSQQTSNSCPPSTRGSFTGGPRIPVPTTMARVASDSVLELERMEENKLDDSMVDLILYCEDRDNDAVFFGDDVDVDDMEDNDSHNMDIDIVAAAADGGGGLFEVDLGLGVLNAANSLQTPSTLSTTSSNADELLLGSNMFAAAAAAAMGHGSTHRIVVKPATGSTPPTPPSSSECSSASLSSSPMARASGSRRQSSSQPMAAMTVTSAKAPVSRSGDKNPAQLSKATKSTDATDDNLSLCISMADLSEDTKRSPLRLERGRLSQQSQSQQQTSSAAQHFSQIPAAMGPTTSLSEAFKAMKAAQALQLAANVSNAFWKQNQRRLMAATQSTSALQSAVASRSIASRSMSSSMASTLSSPQLGRSRAQGDDQIQAYKAAERPAFLGTAQLLAAESRMRAKTKGTKKGRPKKKIKTRTQLPTTVNPPTSFPSIDSLMAAAAAAAPSTNHSSANLFGVGGMGAMTAMAAGMQFPQHMPQTSTARVFDNSSNPRFAAAMAMMSPKQKPKQRKRGRPKGSRNSVKVSVKSSASKKAIKVEKSPATLKIAASSAVSTAKTTKKTKSYLGAGIPKVRVPLTLPPMDGVIPVQRAPVSASTTEKRGKKGRGRGRGRGKSRAAAARSRGGRGRGRGGPPPTASLFPTHDRLGRQLPFADRLGLFRAAVAPPKRYK